MINIGLELIINPELYRVQNLAGEILVSIFWDKEGINPIYLWKREITEGNGSKSLRNLVNGNKSFFATIEQLSITWKETFMQIKKPPVSLRIRMRTKPFLNPSEWYKYYPEVITDTYARTKFWLIGLLCLHRRFLVNNGVMKIWYKFDWTNPCTCMQ